jgi:thiamine-phosphate pyrophosphorylase
MAHRSVLYYITDRTAFAADEPSRRRRLLDKIAEAARAGVDYIQLREKDLPTRELEMLAQEAVQAVREASKLASVHWPLTPALLINSRTDIALASGADGVHLRSDDITPPDVRAVWEKCGAGAPARELSPREPLIGVSCHSPRAVKRAEAEGATFAVFAPVFEKKDVPSAHPAGLAQLREACKVKIPVLALGGVTLENVRLCLEVGASGIAAIRLFQDNEISAVVAKLRGMTL